jgi:hypothetical protein
MGMIRVALLCTLVACAAGCAFAAPGASATSLAEWVIEGETMNELSLTEESVSATSTGSFELKSKVLGSPFRLKCEGIGASGKLRQEAKGELTLEWSKCAVLEPSGCKTSEKITHSISSTTIETSEKEYEKFAPSSGETLMEVSVNGCALEGKFPVKGTAFCPQVKEVEESETSEETLEKVEQPFTYSEAISTAAGCGTYKLGKEPATIAGEYVQNFKLAGPRAGKRFAPVRAAICKKPPNAGNKACPQGEAYEEREVKGTIQAGAKVELTTGVWSIECNKSSFVGSWRPQGRGTVTGIIYEDTRAAAGTHRCMVAGRPGETEVLLTFLELPTLTSKFQFKPDTEPINHEGLLWWARLLKEIPLKIGFAAETCIYEGSISWGFIVNGVGVNPSKVGVALNWVAVEAEHGNLGLCPNLTEPNAFFNLASKTGGNIYVTKP